MKQLFVEVWRESGEWKCRVDNGPTVACGDENETENRARAEAHRIARRQHAGELVSVNSVVL
jgi:hypothetical protein